MIHTADLYYFSPTGGTKKVGECFGKAAAEQVTMVNLAAGELEGSEDAALAVIAMPVFGGRIPAFGTEQLLKVNGNGKKAVTLAVYGNRAYEDALLELNDTAKAAGFQVIASGAFVAEHSMNREVAAGRPDQEDEGQLQSFAQRVLEKLALGGDMKVSVPGNEPYKPHMQRMATPVCTEDCGLCGACAKACPVDAIEIKEAVVTDPEKCILCMACASACTRGARVLPAPMKAHLQQLLGPLKEVRRENEIFL